MSGGLVDDYLAQLLGAASGPAAPAAGAPAAGPSAPDSPPAPVQEPSVATPKPPAAPVPAAPANPDEITEDEFEALLDALHGDKPPGASSPAPVAATAPSAAPAAPANPDEITEDEFEALLDALHGDKPPGASSPAPAPASPLAAAAAVAVAAARAGQSEGGRRAGDAGDPEPADEGAWRGQERRASRRSSRWLRLHVHQQDYAVELLKVQEVLLPVPVLPMRDTSPAILGVMNLRGVVVPVLDLGLWLGLEEVQDTPQTRYVVLEQNGECLALKVTAVLDVHAIADADIEPAEHTLAAPESAMLSGVTRLNSQPVILLDAVGLLG
ncbi:chemotaxis protein CheW [Silanimonas lenta]|uniref:chemotaxis protein CheW n=1 Tax=Silanimonas lenta TaxID=265429 RepID=UPI00041B980B|nr:chemotaxis protein CheW [Silanimonas lenta]